MGMVHVTLFNCNVKPFGTNVEERGGGGKGGGGGRGLLLSRNKYRLDRIFHFVPRPSRR